MDRVTKARTKARANTLPKRVAKRKVATAAAVAAPLSAMAAWAAQKARDNAVMTLAEAQRITELADEVEALADLYGEHEYERAKYELIPLFPGETA